MDGRLIFHGIDVSHQRLVELTLLADQCKPFYDWVEQIFQQELRSTKVLDQLLQTASLPDLQNALTMCYTARDDLPKLFDGLGRTYPHTRACYYFFAWMIRDAPQQRLAPLIQRIVRQSGKNRVVVEIEVLASLIYDYRGNVRSFAWEAVREIIIDRLEGSRRSLKGHQKEVIVRTALLTAFQTYYAQYQNYGIYADIAMTQSQMKAGSETVDVVARLLDNEGRQVRRVLVPIKTRETEGGGHAHLFSRDLSAALSTMRTSSPNDFIAVILVAKNWSPREVEVLSEQVDHLAFFDLSPGEFVHFHAVEQGRLNTFVASILQGNFVKRA
ncbi:MAG: hypothetical protein SF029_23040 [bacterium]|nr:hypothetical protein [bacterium]